MRTVITGAAGFIGGHLLEALIKDGDECLGMDDLSIHSGEMPDWMIENEIPEKAHLTLGKYGDCREKRHMGDIKRFEPETIFNLAVKPLPHSLVLPVENFITNTEITINILELVRTTDTKLIHFSSSEVYGTAEDDMMDEEHVLHPTTPYAAAKVACDHLVGSYVKTYGIDAVIVRPFNTIGPRQNDAAYAAVIPKTVRRIKEGKGPIIYGDGLNTRDFTAVEDIVEGAITASKKGKRGEIYNLCSSKETSIMRVMDIISGYLGYEGEYEFSEERIGDVVRHLGNNNKAKKELGWEPKIPLCKAMRRAIYG